jgi:CBS domain-containing protein
MGMPREGTGLSQILRGGHMQSHKLVRDIMSSVLDFPFAPHWCTIRQAIEILQKAVPEGSTSVHPIGLLVFDEKNNLLGSLGIREILKGLEPRFLRPVTDAQGLEESEPELSIIWDSLFDTQARQMAEHKVGDYLIPVKFFVDPDDPVTKAAYYMVHHNLAFLPVLEERKKLVGVVKMYDVFQELSNLLSQ